MTISSATRRLVHERAEKCCEYCRTASISLRFPFHIDHIIPIRHDGSDEIDNLCLACYFCNANKGYDLTGFDPKTGKISQLYNPRQQMWDDHFELQDDMEIHGLTPEGRTTVKVLQMNIEQRVQNRQLWFVLGEYPC